MSQTDTIRSIVLAAGSTAEPCTSLAGWLAAAPVLQDLAVEVDWSGRIAVRITSAHQAMQFAAGLGRAEVEEAAAAARAITEAADRYFIADAAAKAVTEALPVNGGDQEFEGKAAIRAYLGRQAEAAISEEMDAILGVLPHGLLTRDQVAEAIRERFDDLAELDHEAILAKARVTIVAVAVRADDGESFTQLPDDEAEWSWGAPDAYGVRVTVPFGTSPDDVTESLMDHTRVRDDTDVKIICRAMGWTLLASF